MALTEKGNTEKLKVAELKQETREIFLKKKRPSFGADTDG